MHNQTTKNDNIQYSAANGNNFTTFPEYDNVLGPPGPNLQNPGTSSAGEGSSNVSSNSMSRFKYTYVTFLQKGGYGQTYVVTRTSDNLQCVCKIIPFLKDNQYPHLNNMNQQQDPQRQDQTQHVVGGPNDSQNINADKKNNAKTTFNAVITEMRNLSRVSHHFGVTSFYDAYIVDEHALLFMEFCNAGDLHQEISRRRRILSAAMAQLSTVQSQPSQSSSEPQEQPPPPGSYFDEQTVLVVITQITMALYHLHINNMMHRDVKASNVLLCTNGLVKLGDFGLSKTQTMASTFCGTPSSLAPEVWSRNRYSMKADVWSLGVVMYHMIAQKMPFKGGHEELKRSIVNGTYAKLADLIYGNGNFDTAFEANTTRSPNAPNSSYYKSFRSLFRREVLELCDAMMTADPAARPDTGLLLRHPVLNPVVEMFPLLLENSPNVTPAMRGEVIECLRKDGIFPLPAPNAWGSNQHIQESPAGIHSEQSQANQQLNRQNFNNEPPKPNTTDLSNRIQDREDVVTNYAEDYYPQLETNEREKELSRNGEARWSSLNDKDNQGAAIHPPTQQHTQQPSQKISKREHHKSTSAGAIVREGKVWKGRGGDQQTTADESDQNVSNSFIWPTEWTLRHLRVHETVLYLCEYVKGVTEEEKIRANGEREMGALVDPEKAPRKLKIKDILYVESVPESGKKSTDGNSQENNLLFPIVIRRHDGANFVLAADSAEAQATWVTVLKATVAKAAQA